MALSIILTLGVLIAAGALIAVVYRNGAGSGPHGQAGTAAITVDEYDSVKVGPGGNSRKRIEARFGPPRSVQALDSAGAQGRGGPAAGRECVYYRVQGKKGSLFELCFDARTQRVQSKRGLIALFNGAR
jgi:hypothetical protein